MGFPAVCAAKVVGVIVGMARDAIIAMAANVRIVACRKYRRILESFFMVSGV
jgi:hypothetical protein